MALLLKHRSSTVGNSGRTEEIEVMCRCGGRPNSDYEIIHTQDGRVLIIRLPQWLKQYRQARSRQLQYLDAINWLTGTPHHERSVAVTMKVMDEFRRTRGGDRLPRINAAFTSANQAVEYKENLTQYELPHLFRSSENTWKASKESNFFHVDGTQSLNVPEPKFKLPVLSKEANHMFPSSRGSLRVRLSYQDQ